MSYDGWIKFNGTEIVNLSRTAQLAQAIGLETVWISPEDVQWIDDSFSLHPPYDDITSAPWYDAGYLPSTEFVGVIPLSIQGLGDSTLQSNPVEYINDGGNPGRSRNATLPLVWNVAIMATTDRGAAYGKRWLDRILRGGSSGSSLFCAGSDLQYFAYEGAGSPQVHLRDVKTTRGTSITNKRIGDCAATWTVTFTMTAGDPYEYGVAISQVGDLGSTSPTGSRVTSFGSLVLTQSDCAVYDYSPIYDPLYPALVPSPTAPDFLPNGWGIVDGETFERMWARLSPVEPSSLAVVPVFSVSSDIEARSVRLSIWPAASAEDDQCDPLFSAVISYLPGSGTMYLDGEQRAAYFWDGLGNAVRRCDSLVYGPTARPVEWPSFNDPDGLLVTLDIFYVDSGLYEGGGDVRAYLSLVSKSD